MIDLLITEDPLNVNEAYSKALNNEAGAINIFSGTIRNKTQSKEVLRLEYEAYEKMATKEMEKIASKAMKKWPVKNIVIHHRYGLLNIGDCAVIIAVSTPHRKESFEACEFIINTLKETVPIWKKEVFEDGEVWVASHP
ncbi:MAG: molybdenum cofactor biosynthesis protein MoaE [Saprospiraceae bacterium]|nr:molybdenum cofactor biosynthesis protein MoaE [Saprospiraceae bacterium]